MKKIESLDTMVRDFLEGRLSSKKRALFLQFIKHSRDTSKLSEIHASLFDQIQLLSKDELIQLQDALKKEEKVIIRPLWRKLAPYAAALLCIGGFLFFNQYKVNTTDFPIALNPIGATNMVTLEDGTEVILKGKSSISDVSFTQTERTLTLTGDAYFKVKPNSTPFSVRTESGYNTRVLGTQFEVQAKENTFMVNVDKGRVFVSKGKSELAVLQKGDYIKVADGKEEIHSTLAPSLDFDNRSLDEIVKSLSENYDTHIVVAADVNSNIKTRVSFDKKLSIVEAIQLLCEINNLKYTFESNKIILQK